MGLTDVEKREKIRKAIRLRKEANKIIFEAERLFRECGIELVYAQTRVWYNEMPSIHVYSGINSIAELFELKSVPPLDYMGKEIKSELSVEIDGTLLFELLDEETGTFK